MRAIAACIVICELKGWDSVSISYLCKKYLRMKGLLNSLFKNANAVLVLGREAGEEKRNHVAIMEQFG